MGSKPKFAPSAVKTLAQWQELTGNDAGSTISADMDLARVLRQARQYLQLTAAGHGQQS